MKITLIIIGIIWSTAMFIAVYQFGLVTFALRKTNLKMKKLVPLEQTSKLKGLSGLELLRCQNTVINSPESARLFQTGERQFKEFVILLRVLLVFALVAAGVAVFMKLKGS